ncbi:hypothetical protein GCM10023185_20210 [Hymenobacter saemangeumensis]|uniref:UspA domain-containing protein n=1 Tax=Hymenobacter saemangeumensis TaxID=1084522 RepID=A0ABP8ID41_9BACT
MPLTLIALAGFYAPDRAAVRYADALAQALHANLVLLHVNRAALVDPYELLDESYRRDELVLQADTVSALRRVAGRLRTPATVELSTDLLPAVAQDLAERYGPALFVLGQPAEEAAASIVPACVELLRAGQYPLLLVPAAAPAAVPQCFLVAADAEPFALSNEAQAWRPLLSRLGAEVLVAHVSAEGEDSAACAAALRAVQASGLLQGLPAPELRGYSQPQASCGILAAVQETQADVLILLARERSYLSELFHRSVTAQVLKHTPVPVLLLPVE